MDSVKLNWYPDITTTFNLDIILIICSIAPIPSEEKFIELFKNVKSHCDRFTSLCVVLGFFTFL